MNAAGKAHGKHAAGAILVGIGLLLWCSTSLLAHQGYDHKNKTSGAATEQDQRAAANRRGSARWGADYFPNVPLVSHEGKTVRFFDDVIKDKVVILYFMYASCEDTCPLETARLVNVQRILGDRVGTEVFMYAITVDPANDTPEVLKKYAERYGVGPGWVFLTGKEADIILLRKKFGLYSEDTGDEITDHNISVVLGNQRTGRWMKRSPFDNPYMIAAQVGSWLVNWKLPENDNTHIYAQSPQRRSLSLGGALFEGRCSACHTIGEGLDTADGKPRAGREEPMMGPDLLGVTKRRDRAWLARLLKEPDKMLAERDPIVMELYAKYNNVPMPNLRLSEVEVQALIDYMHDESLRVEKNRSRLSRQEP